MLVAAAASQPAGAGDWRTRIGTFRVGIVAEPGAGNTVPGLGQLTDAYSKALGMEVEFLVARDYAALVEAQAAGRLHYAVHSALSYAATVHRCGCVEPLASPSDGDRAVGMRSVLIRREGAAGSSATTRKIRIAVAPPDDVAGSLLPLAGRAFSLSGQSVATWGEIAANSASDAERMLANGEADAMFGWQKAAPEGEPDPAGGTLARLEAAGVPPGQLKVLWRSDVLRYGPHAVLEELDSEAKRRLGVFLLNLKAQSPQIHDLLETRHAGGFVRASSPDYRAAQDVIQAISAETGSPAVSER